MTRPHAAHALLRLLAVCGLMGIALAPLLPLLTAQFPGTEPLAAALGPWFDFHCERDPARTLSLGGVPLAVCARCSGVYFGVGLGALIRQPQLAPPVFRLWLGGGAALMLLDVMAEEHGLHGAWPLMRLLTGVLLAYPLGVWATRPAVASAQSP